MAKRKKGKRKMNPKSLQNLTPAVELNARLTPEKRTENARKAGIASGKARSFQSIAKELLTNDDKEDFIRAQMEMAREGNINSFRLLMEIGDVPEGFSEEDDLLSKNLEELARSMELDDQ